MPSVTDVNTSTSFHTNGTFTVSIQPGAGVYWMTKKLAVRVYPNGGGAGDPVSFDVVFGSAGAPLAMIAFSNPAAVIPTGGSLGFSIDRLPNTTTFAATLNPNACDGTLLTNTHYLQIRCQQNTNSATLTVAWAFSGVIVP